MYALGCDESPAAASLAENVERIKTGAGKTSPELSALMQSMLKLHMTNRGR